MAAVDTLTARLVSGHELVPSWNSVGALVAVACAGLATPVHVARCGRCDVPHRTRTALWLACGVVASSLLKRGSASSLLKRGSDWPCSRCRWRHHKVHLPRKTAPRGRPIRGPPPRFRRPHHLRSLRTRLVHGPGATIVAALQHRQAGLRVRSRERHVGS